MRRISQRRAVKYASAAVLIALAATACSSSGGSGGSGSSGSKAPISIGQVGAYKGPVPGLDGQGYGMQAWVDYTNAHGGVDGHHLNLYVGDSQGDPTTEVSQIEQIATQHNVVAFAGMGTFNLAASAAFLASQKIPVVGGNNADIIFNEKPYLYAQGTAFVPLIATGFGAIPKGVSKVGIVYCSESPGCAQTYDVLFKDGITKAAGGNGVYASEVALSSPSFTAECLAAKQAGVQVLAVAFDSADLLRLATNCNAQNYHPVYAFGGTVATDQLAGPTFMNGSVSSQSNAPWFLSTGPLATMKAAMAKYQPGKAVGSIAVEGWTSGVILGQALENALAHNSSGTITRQDVVNGLAEIKNDTFGGLTPPISFSASGVQPESFCYFPIVVSAGKWTAPNGLTPVCASGAELAAIKAAQSSLEG
jgi:branched-chain amino acid transport system substrate-binding protein